MWDQPFTILLTCLALCRLKTCCSAYRHKLAVQFPRSHQSLCSSWVLHRFSACCLPMTDGTSVTKLVLSLHNTFKCNVEAYFCYRPNLAHLFWWWISSPWIGLTTKRWVFASDQNRFQWHLTLNLCMIKQTYKTPLAPTFSPLDLQRWKLSGRLSWRQ